jgi:acylglycerol lipase
MQAVQVADFEARVAAARTAHAAASKPSPPMFVAGHSLGGLVAAHTAAKNPSQFAGLILHSAAIDVEWNWVLRYLVA